jgi:transglutaminase-like putative cysteine protease/tetratricopeptide (TPR) repeat protein
MNRTVSYRIAASAAALACSCASQAGETPRFEAAPNWVEVVSVPSADKGEDNNLIVSDQQVRVEDGSRWDYHDKVYRLSDLKDMSDIGTLKFQWLPDKGDLIIHEISIIRNGKVIDVLGRGEGIEVLRREQRLEMGLLDGSLTATIAVPGLVIGDRVRTRFSVTLSDQALERDVQGQFRLPRKPSPVKGNAISMMLPGRFDQEADYSRVTVSWPVGLDLSYKTGRGVEITSPVVRDGYQWLEVMLPLPASDPAPQDAPLRYRMPPALQIGTFADWAEVSGRMAPFYSTRSSLDGMRDLVDKVDAIGARPISVLDKAVAALEIVQEDIRYLMNGLDGGNYIPQSVQSTWQLKYGDCKAKTVLLLALLNHLGIEAQGVLVSTNYGNAVPDSLPIPGAFNHVLVRALIDGQEYFLDGTTVGANIKTVGNVPSFEYYLPIQESGATLKKIEQTLPLAPDSEIHFEVDGSAGVDIPVLGTLKIAFVGARAVQINAQKEKMKDVIASGIASNMGKGSQVIDTVVEQGEDNSQSTLTITGIFPPLFTYEGSQGEFSPGRIDKAAKFTPNRSQKQWQDVPVTTGRMSSEIYSMRAKLPLDARELVLKGKLQFEAEAIGKMFSRKTEVAGSEILVMERVTNLGGEISPDRLAEERRKAAAVAREKLSFLAPTDAPRRWRFAGKADRSALQPLEQAFAQAIANKPDEVPPLEMRARFRMSTYDFAGAVADLSAAIDIKASADLLMQRAEMHSRLRDWASAKADLESAYSLDPSPATAIKLANTMAHQSEFVESRELLMAQGGDSKSSQLVAFELAELDALEGDKEAGIERIEEELADDPNNPTLFNAKCWFIGTWKVQLEQGEEACRLAVERGGNPAQALDSRAMYNLRTGMIEKARADIEEALDLAPWQAASLLLRGVIKREQNDDTAQQDIANAIARQPDLVDTYSRWGFTIK